MMLLYKYERNLIDTDLLNYYHNIMLLLNQYRFSTKIMRYSDQGRRGASSTCKAWCGVNVSWSKLWGSKKTSSILNAN